MFETLKTKFFSKKTIQFYKKNYFFTEDWFTPHISIWQSKLGPWIGKDNLQALEIGTFQGRSAFWLLENILTSKTSRLTCIDPYPGPRLSEAYEVFKRNLKMSGLGNKITLIKDRSDIILPTLQGRLFDIIYIDGHHEGDQVTYDGEACWKLLKPGGIMIFDDYNLPNQYFVHQSPKDAIDTFLEKHSGEFSVVHKGYQVFIVKT